MTSLRLCSFAAKMPPRMLVNLVGSIERLFMPPNNNVDASKKTQLNEKSACGNVFSLSLAYLTLTLLRISSCVNLSVLRYTTIAPIQDIKKTIAIYIRALELRSPTTFFFKTL